MLRSYGTAGSMIYIDRNFWGGSEFSAIYLHPNRELEGIVGFFEYLRWTRRYSLCGSFGLRP
jgi:hypothetical protein